MQKLTITVEDEVYKALYASVGKGKISRYINDMTKSSLKKNKYRQKIREGYAAMAADNEYEKEAFEWIEANIDDGLEDAPW